MSKVLFAVSGSIAAMKAAQVVSLLVRAQHDVQVVATPSALKFVGSATWEGLTQKPVLSDLFEPGHQMDHIHLARWADLLILCPATAHSIGQWANGLANDLPSTLFLAFERAKPVLIVPAMNKEMWGHPMTQNNVRALNAIGIEFVAPEIGALACGEVGAGRLASPDMIYARIENALKKKAGGRGLLSGTSGGRGHVLITSGATRERVDQVRFITNMSTGKTGAHIADQFARAGWQVTYLHGESALLPQSAAIHSVSFSDYESLAQLLRLSLSEINYQVIIQCAAVSDYTIADVQSETGSLLTSGGKLKSEQNLVLHLKATSKLILNLKEWARLKNPVVIGFKLTDTQDPKEQKAAVSRLLERAEVDVVVWNNLDQVGHHRHQGLVYQKSGFVTPFENKDDLSSQLISIAERVADDSRN
jgi:phosphopantothenoylcysteine decarboxylase/phosphopantothenate--cysteine ligase